MSEERSKGRPLLAYFGALVFGLPTSMSAIPVRARIFTTVVDEQRGTGEMNELSLRYISYIVVLFNSFDLMSVS